MQKDKGHVSFGLRCVAYEAKNNGTVGYYAVCIDLNLTTWRPTLGQAKSSLDQAIQGYLETSFDVKKELAEQSKDLDAFVKKHILRPAPFFPWQFIYYFAGLLNFLQFSSLRATTKYKSPIALPA